LLEIPCEIVLYVIVVELGAILNNLILGKDRFPFIALAVMLVASMGLFLLILLSIVNFIKYTVKRNKKKQAAKEAMKVPVEPEKKA
jgi:L-asparagine transporter-like permease